MKLNSIFLTFALIPAVLTVACQRMEPSLQQLCDDSAGENVVSYSASVLPMEDSRDASKAQLINADGEQSIDFDTTSEFYVTAWTHGVTTAAISRSKVKYFMVTAPEKGGFWSTTDASGQIVEYKWYEGQNKTFYAYANLPADGNSSVVCESADGQELDYISPENVDEQTDILMACYDGNGSVGGYQCGTVSLLFKHPLSAIVIKAGEISHVNTINKITVENVSASGNAVMDAGGNITWTADENTIDMVQDFTSSPLVPVKGDQLGETVLVIPENFGESHKKARIRINVTTDYDVEKPTFDIFLPLNTLVFEAGKLYNVSLNYGQEE